ncbi:MAG: hypothetical protein ACE5H1_09645 [Thermodesulfobacteriota bacterium]
MSEEIKSGKKVIDEFFAEIYNVEGVDEKTVETIVSLYSEKKLTDINIQNVLENLLKDELDKTEKENDQD